MQYTESQTDRLDSIRLPSPLREWNCGIGSTSRSSIVANQEDRQSDESLRRRRHDAWSDWSGFSGCATFDRVWRRPRRFRVYCVVKGALRMSRRLIIAFASSRAPTTHAPRPQQAMFSTAQHYPTQSTQHRRSVLIEPSDSPTKLYGDVQLHATRGGGGKLHPKVPRNCVQI